MNINCSIQSTTIFTFSHKFNTESRIDRYDKMKPLFFKLAHGQFQPEKWLFLDRVLDDLSIT